MRKFSRIIIVIPNWNAVDLLQDCLKSIRENTTYPNYETIVVDNASKDSSVEMVEKEFPNVDLIRNEENLGFPKACNQGIMHALEKYNSDFVLLLNNDTKITQKGWLEKLVEVAERDDKIGIVNCKIIYPSGKLQHAAGWVKPWGEWSWTEIDASKK